MEQQQSKMQKHTEQVHNARLALAVLAACDLWDDLLRNALAFNEALCCLFFILRFSLIIQHVLNMASSGCVDEFQACDVTYDTADIDYKRHTAPLWP